MQTRFSFGGDEHIFAEVDEAMSLEAFFKSLSVTKAVRAAQIRGVTEICPANASFQIKFDPDVIKPDDLLRELKSIEAAAARGGHSSLKTRIIDLTYQGAPISSAKAGSGGPDMEMSVPPGFSTRKDLSRVFES